MNRRNFLKAGGLIVVAPTCLLGGTFLPATHKGKVGRLFLNGPIAICPDGPPKHLRDDYLEYVSHKCEVELDEYGMETKWGSSGGVWYYPIRFPHLIKLTIVFKALPNNSKEPCYVTEEYHALVDHKKRARAEEITRRMEDMCPEPLLSSVKEDESIVKPKDGPYLTRPIYKLVHYNHDFKLASVNYQSGDYRWKGMGSSQILVC